MTTTQQIKPNSKKPNSLNILQNSFKGTSR
jgi:hypothetical protein